MKVIISFITFNCLKYTKLCLESIKCSYPHEILVIDNGSTDGTIDWLKTQKVTLIENGQNLGVPHATNTMYDYTWKDDKDNLLVNLANDMVFLPNAVDELVKAALESDCSVISGDEIQTPVYLDRYPEDRRFFAGGNNIAINPKCEGYSSWGAGQLYNLIEGTASEFISIMNNRLIPLLPKHELAGCGYFIPAHRLYKYKYFDAIGYWDVNFYPLYSCDFDYAIRAKLTNQSTLILHSSLSFEFWSRVLYEGKVKPKDVRRDDYLKEKWGPHVAGTDSWDIPFNGSFPEKHRGYDTSRIKIDSRDGELDRIKFLMGSKFKGTCDPRLVSCLDAKCYDRYGETCIN